MQKHRSRKRLRTVAVFGCIFLFYICAFALFNASGYGGHRRRLSSGEATCDNALDDIVPLAIAVYFFLLIFLFIGVGSLTDDWFVPSLSLISKTLNLSEDVAGATFMAAGSSAPELFTSLVDTFYSKSSIGIGTIVGSAVFNILVIIACSGAFSDSPDGLEIDWRPLCRDVSFYLFSIYLLVQFIYLDGFMGSTKGKAEWWEGLIMLAGYIVYVIYMGYNRQIQEACCSREGDDAGEEEVEYFRSCVVAGLPPKMLKGAGKTTRLVKELDDNVFAKYGIQTEVSPTMILIRFDHECRIDTVIKPLQNDLQDFLEWEYYSEDIRVLALDPVKRSEAIDSDDDQEGAKIHQQLLHRDDSDHTEAGSESILDWFTEVLTDCWGFAFGLTIANCNVESPLAEIAALDLLLQEMESKQSELETSSGGPTTRVKTKLENAMQEKLEEQQKHVDELHLRETRFVRAFVQSILWIGVLTFGMVFFAQKLGCLIGIPPIIMGVTFLAAGTSIPDAFASIAAAKSGLGNMAVANAIGSNVFDILIGLGFPWLLHGIIYKKPYDIDTDGIMVQIIILFLTVILIVGSFMYTGWILNKLMGTGLLAAYFLFATYTVVESYLS